MPVDVLLATCDPLPEPDPDARPLERALTAAGLSWRWAAWHDAVEDWRAGATLIRSTWNYLHDPPGFLAWAEAAHAAGRLFNTPRVVRWNLHKRYLETLSAAGVATVPTVLCPRGAPADPRAIAEARGWGRIVVKPAVSAGSYATHAFDSDAVDDTLCARLIAERDMLVQPFVASVSTVGERSLVWIDGAFTHAVRKHPRFAADAERVDGPVPIEPAELRLAQRALDAAARQGALLYARVDLVRDADGAPMVAELELVEPSLFFDRGPGSVERLVAALARRLS